MFGVFNFQANKNTGERELLGLRHYLQNVLPLKRDFKKEKGSRYLFFILDRYFSSGQFSTTHSLTSPLGASSLMVRHTALIKLPPTNAGDDGREG